ncbi:hypothetical protein GCM10010252_54440 [Streptomyces aureoverticillatus]|nr:hypothetical protein GCM10010252_54440 [Streptomyces aureoverticillatus]
MTTGDTTGGVTVADVAMAGVTLADVAMAGVTLADLATVGVTLADVTAEGVMDLSSDGTDLTVRATCRQPADMPPELLLFERVHVDLARHASARCWSR